MGAISRRNQLEREDGPKEPDRGIDPQVPSVPLEEPEEGPEDGLQQVDVTGLPPVNIDEFRAARVEQHRQAESDDYGESDVLEDNDDHVVVKPRLSPLPLDDLLFFEKIRRAERAAKPAPRTNNYVDNFLAKSRTNPGARPPAPASGSKELVAEAF